MMTGGFADYGVHVIVHFNYRVVVYAIQLWHALWLNVLLPCICCWFELWPLKMQNSLVAARIVHKSMQISSLLSALCLKILA